MGNRVDPKSHIGETHGIYTLIDVSEVKDKYGHYIYKGVCNNCGYIKCSHYGDFSGEKSKAIVCNHIDVDGEYIRTTSWGNKRICKIFKDMKARCYNPNDKSYCWYGKKKGIKICDEWIKKPKKHLKNGR